MNITFTPLTSSHFPLLLKWLETPHVKAWWDTKIQWTPELIQKKYENYVKGYKQFQLKGRWIQKPIKAYIVLCDSVPVGYIQYYNRNDFPFDEKYKTIELPKNCAGLDMYIGETDYLRQGIGSIALNKFLNDFVFHDFDYVFDDPDTANIAGVKLYEKAGYQIIKKIDHGKITGMIKTKVDIHS